MPIQIEVSGRTYRAELGDTPCAEKIHAALPIEGRVSTWGEEIYFSIPVEAEEEPNAGEVVQLGDLGFWPVGSALCIFFGKTPASRGDEIRAASAVNLVGKVLDDLEGFKAVRDGEKITVRESP